MHGLNQVWVSYLADVLVTSRSTRYEPMTSGRWVLELAGEPRWTWSQKAGAYTGDSGCWISCTPSLLGILALGNTAGDFCWFLGVLATHLIDWIDVNPVCKIIHWQRWCKLEGGGFESHASKCKFPLTIILSWNKYIDWISIMCPLCNVYANSNNRPLKKLSSIEPIHC